MIVVTSFSLSCLATSVTQPSPKDSQAIMVTGRAPSIDHMRHLDRAGIGRRHDADEEIRRHFQHRARLLDGALELRLAALARCERPRNASLRAWRVQPGRLAQGPDEKCGTAGRTPGIAFVMIYPSR